MLSDDLRTEKSLEDSEMEDILDNQGGLGPLLQGGHRRGSGWPVALFWCRRNMAARLPHCSYALSPLGQKGEEELRPTGTQDEVWCSFMHSDAIWPTWMFLDTGCKGLTKHSAFPTAGVKQMFQ